MTGQLIGQLILWLIVAVVVIAIIYWVMQWLYRRSTKEVAFVRTGFLGEKVVIDGGAFVWPIIHDITPVNMNTLPLPVSRTKDAALITKDRMRVDVEAEFYVRVRPDAEVRRDGGLDAGPPDAGGREPARLLSGKFESALRAVAAEMDDGRDAREPACLCQPGARGRAGGSGEERAGAGKRRDHRHRPDGAGILQPLEPLRRRGSDRADQGHRGAAKAAQRHRAGFDDPDPRAQPRGREDRAGHRARERGGAAGAGADVEFRRAQQRAELARERAERDTEAEAAQITAREAIEKARIANEKAIAEARIASERSVRAREIARQRRTRPTRSRRARRPRPPASCRSAP
jgi:uncharacterized membrane protein YqiK